MYWFFFDVLSRSQFNKLFSKPVDFHLGLTVGAVLKHAHAGNIGLAVHNTATQPDVEDAYPVSFGQVFYDSSG